MTARSRRCAPAPMTLRRAGRRSSGRPPPGTSTTSCGNAPPPPGMLPAEVDTGRHLAFKTGTSYGFRDAWAVGYDAQVTIAVWAGRPDGTPMPGPQRPGDRGAGAVQDRRPARPRAGRDRAGAAARRSARSPVATCRRRCAGSTRRRAKPARGRAPAGRKSSTRPMARLLPGTGRALPLEAAGGNGPLRWLVDGRPLPPAQPRRTLYWQPAGIGFVRLTVIDAKGRSARATVRLAP